MKTLCSVILLLALCIAPASAVIHRALVFGLGEQEDEAWGKINGDNDVYYVVQYLQKAGYTDIVTLKNKQATKAKMTEAFKALVSRCQKDDIVYIHYSGHGQLITDLDGDESLKWNNSHADWDESWIPYDAYMTYNPKDRGEKHLSDDEVAGYLQAIRRKIGRKGELVVVVDACHSGDATCGEDEERVRGVDLKFNMPRKLNAEMGKLIPEEWLTVSACKPYQLCTEMKGMKVGKLTYALYKMGMGILKKDSGELEQALDSFMKQHQGRIRQTPMVTGNK